MVPDFPEHPVGSQRGSWGIRVIIRYDRVTWHVHGVLILLGTEQEISYVSAHKLDHAGKRLAVSPNHPGCAVAGQTAKAGSGQFNYMCSACGETQCDTASYMALACTNGAVNASRAHRGYQGPGKGQHSAAASIPHPPAQHTSTPHHSQACNIHYTQQQCLGKHQAMRQRPACLQAGQHSCSASCITLHPAWLCPAGCPAPKEEPTAAICRAGSVGHIP